MSLIPFQKYVQDNPYGFTESKLRYLIKTKPGADKVFRRISDRSIFVDEESMEEWLTAQKFYTVKRSKKAKV